MSVIDVLASTQPVTVPRANGLGWMAVSPAGVELRLAVEAPSEDEAVERFREAAKRWVELLSGAER